MTGSSGDSGDALPRDLEEALRDSREGVTSELSRQLDVENGLAAIFREGSAAGARATSGEKFRSRGEVSTSPARRTGVARMGQVFVSHTSDMAQFPEDRSFVQAALDAVNRAGSVPVDMRYFPARDRTPADYCREKVRQCEAYVAVIGLRYGSIVPDEAVSYTELEFNEASTAGLPRLVFLFDPPSALPAPLVDADRGAIEEFRQRLRSSGLVVRAFSSAAALELEVFHALTEAAAGMSPEAHELAGVLRDIADSHGLTLRHLEEKMPYGRTSISVRLSGESRPEWKFVTSFLAACASGDLQASALLEGRVRPLWEAAGPARSVAHASSGPVPADVGAWVAAMRETAAAQQVVARLQLSASRNITMVQGLMVMIARLTAAAQTLAGERDALRGQLTTYSDTAGELLRTRAVLDDTQSRLEAAEQLLAQTSRRLDEALRQREETDRLRETAVSQAREARWRLAQIERHAIAFADSVRAEAQPDTHDVTLMDDMDQLLAAEILRKVDDSLGAEASALDQLHGELASASRSNVASSGGQSAESPARQASGPAVPLLQRLAERQVAQAARFVQQMPSGGEIAYDGEDRDWLLDLTREAERSMDAISLSTVDGGMSGFKDGLWTSDLGARYLEFQREAVARNVRIRRIFVFGDQDLVHDESFLAIIQMQRDIGVEVRTLSQQEVPGGIRPITDFIIFDGAVSYETTPATTFSVGLTRPTVVRTLLTSTPARLRDLEDQFEQLWASAAG